MLTKIKTCSTIVLLLCASVFFLVLSTAVTKVRDDVHTTAVSIQRTAASTQSTMADTRRVLEIAGGTLNIARDTMRDEQKKFKAETDALLQTTRNIDVLVAQATVTLQSVPPLMTTSQETIAKMGATMDGINQVVDGPVMSTMQHVDGVTADVQTEVHRLVFPPPRKWYQKYIVDPLKIAGHLLTYSIK